MTWRFEPTTWLRCPLDGRLQWNGLCQADEGFDAEQVGHETGRTGGQRDDSTPVPK